MILFATAASPSHAADDPLLSRLVGEWTGNGTVRMGPKAEPERVFCKIVGTMTGSNSIRQQGRCSVASNSGALTSAISAKGGGRYEGTMVAPQVGSATFTGRGSASRLSISAGFVDAKTQEKRRATVTMSLLGSGYRVTITNSGDGGSFVASDITFKKK
jgi:hypothetical protein